MDGATVRVARKPTTQNAEMRGRWFGGLVGVGWLGGLVSNHQRWRAIDVLQISRGGGGQQQNPFIKKKHMVFLIGYYGDFFWEVIRQLRMTEWDSKHGDIYMELSEVDQIDTFEQGSSWGAAHGLMVWD